MAEQLRIGLDVRPTTRRTDPDTSHAAASDAEPNAATHRGRALDRKSVV